MIYKRFVDIACTHSSLGIVFTINWYVFVVYVTTQMFVICTQIEFIGPQHNKNITLLFILLNK